MPPSTPHVPADIAEGREQAVVLDDADILDDHALRRARLAGAVAAGARHGTRTGHPVRRSLLVSALLAALLTVGTGMTGFVQAQLEARRHRPGWGTPASQVVPGGAPAGAPGGAPAGR